MDGRLLEDIVVQTGKCLVLRLLTKKHYNLQAFWQTMRITWRLSQRVKFRDLGKHISLVEFIGIQDKQSIIRDGPWCFDEHLVLMNGMNGTKQVQQLQFPSAHFWVCLHDLPNVQGKKMLVEPSETHSEMLEKWIPIQISTHGGFTCGLGWPSMCSNLSTMGRSSTLALIIHVG